MKASVVSLAAFLVCGCVSYAKPLPVIRTNEAGGAAPVLSGRARQVRLKTIIVDVPMGHDFGEMSWGSGGRCYRKQRLVNTSGRFELERNNYVDLFTGGMTKLGYSVEDDLELFAGSKERVADLQVAAKVIDAILNECFPSVDDDKLKVRGNAYLEVEWSVYSTIEKKILLVTRTEGSTHGEIETSVGEQGLLRAAFADAVARLARSPAFKDVVDPPERAPEARRETIIKIRRAQAFSGDLKSNVAAIRAAVATVTANKGSGSGFVISEDGKVVTAAHVVAGSKYVKVNTGAGTECYGEVIAASKQRDLALIRLDCGGLRPLPLATQKPAEGGEVFAVGTPLSDKLQFSVTKGVVSALRTFDGMEYIQSDVTVLPGSSGGPLLDNLGNAVGVTSSGIGAPSAPLGVNFFVPVSDIEKYLPVVFE